MITPTPALRALPVGLLLSLACAAPGRAQAPTEDGLADTFERVAGSVVTVHTAERVLASSGDGRYAAVAGIGSGVLISQGGDVLTAAHVVQVAEAIEVTFPDGTTRSAEVVSSEPRTDVALLRLVGGPPRDATVAELGDSDDVRVGDRVFVVGAPLGLSHTLSVGHVSARRPPSGLGGLGPAEQFQTDAAINQGNSGGPMFDWRGRVVGIVSSIVSRSGGSEGLGFAVTSNVARALVLDCPPLWSGMEGILLEDEVAEVLNLPPGRAGLLVQRVAKGSPADALGLRGGRVQATLAGEQLLLGGDVVLTVQGVSVSHPEAYQRIGTCLLEASPQEELVVEILRAGRPLELRGPMPARHHAP